MLLWKPTVFYKKPLEIIPWAKANFYGTNASRTDESLSMTMSFLDDRRQAQRRKTANIREPFLTVRRQTIHDACEIVVLSFGTVQHILADKLNMSRISARFAPRRLSDDQKALRFSLWREIKQQARDDPNFISNMITGVELWVFGYEPKTKQQASQWKSPNSPRPKKERQVRSNAKSIFFVFFVIQSIVH